MKRRFFLKVAATGALASGAGIPLFSSSMITGVRDKWGELLPQNNFGITGDKVTMLGVGGFHIGRMTDYEAQKTIETAIEGGIRFFDAAESYVRGENERKYGRLLTPQYRDDIYLMTKSRARDRKTAMEHLEGSLKRMNTDVIDLWLIHSIDSIEDFDNLYENGTVDAFIEAKKSGKVRHIGFSGHRQQIAHQHVYDKVGDVMEANMLPINVIDPLYESYINNVVPILQRKKQGIIAMKTLSGGAFFGAGFDGRRESSDRVIDRVSVEEAIQFSLSMPNHVLVTGAKDAEMLQEKIDIAKRFQKLTEEDQEELVKRVSDMSGAEVEYYKS